MRPTATLFGAPVTVLDMEGTVALCERLIEERRPVQHVALNAAKVVMMRDDDDLRAIISGCDIVSADGQSVVWAGRALGIPVPERVAGIDLMERLLGVCEKRGWGVYLLGATPEVLERFIGVLKAKYPHLIIAGSRDGYFDKAEYEQVAAEVARSGARVLFMATPSPMKEYFLATNLDRMGSVFAMGVGGSFDVWAGETTRAPVWMQRAGLEWCFRLVQEPRRMWRRYLVGNVRFAMLVLSEMIRRVRMRNPV